jgi:hypothetical protein
VVSASNSGQLRGSRPTQLASREAHWTQHLAGHTEAPQGEEEKGVLAVKASDAARREMQKAEWEGEQHQKGSTVRSQHCTETTGSAADQGERRLHSACTALQGSCQLGSEHPRPSPPSLMLSATQVARTWAQKAQSKPLMPRPIKKCPI